MTEKPLTVRRQGDNRGLAARSTRAAFLLAAGSVLAWIGQAAGQTDLARQLDQALVPAAVKVQVGACVMEVPSGRVLYARNADEPMIPASNMKLLTTALALDAFGAEHQLRTLLARKGDALALVGGGDPGLGDPRLAEAAGQQITDVFVAFAKALAESGATGQVRRLLFDDSIFDAQWRHPNWNENEFSSWYTAPVGGLNFNDNCVDVSVEPAPGSRPAVLLVPECSLFEIDNRLTTGRSNAPLAGRRVGTWQLLLTGQCSRRTQLGPVTVYDPGLFAASVLHDIVTKTCRIEWSGPQRVRIVDQAGRLPEGWQIVAEARSPLVALVQRANTHSQNLFAECLLKLAGATATGGAGSWTGGRIAALQFLRKYDLPTAGLVIDDGSGLSRENRLTTRMLAGLLCRMRQRADWPVWLDSLAVGGESGTLNRRFRGDLKARVYAKTGYIRGVSALSGYIQVADEQWLAFSFLYNGSTTGARQAQDKACQILLEQARQPASRAAEPDTR